MQKIEGLDQLVNLEELWLGKNKISKLEVSNLHQRVWHHLIAIFQNLSALVKLKILSIQSNRLTKLEGLEALSNLEEIYLSHNGIKRIEGLEKNVRLFYAGIW